jgi:hypothetical protein
MATYIRHVCAVPGCGVQLINNDKVKRYGHANVPPEREPHRGIVQSIKMQEVAA